MPEFINPFSGMVPERKMTMEELVRAIRLDVAGDAFEFSISESLSLLIRAPKAICVLT